MELFVGVCRAVQHGHQKKVVHRDLKPSNILVAEVDGKPVPKVIDFGVAKLASGGSGVTRDGKISGTPLYMALEQADSSAHVNTRADIYTLGVILFELLTDRTRADTEALASKTVLGFMLFELIGPVDPWSPVPSPNGPNSELTLATVLDRAAAGVNTRFPDHPEIRDRLREVLGRAYFALTRYPEAEAQAVRWKEDADRRLPADASERGRAAALLARIYAETKRADQAEPLFREALRVVIVEHGTGSREARAAREELANGLSRDGKTEEAIRLLTNLLDTADCPDDRLRVAGNLSAVYVQIGRFPKVIELLAEYAEVKPVNSRDDLDTIVARLHLATAYQEVGKVDKARPLFEGVIKTFRERFGPDHLRTLEARGKLAALHMVTGRHADAAKLYADLIPRVKKALNPMHPLLDEWLGNMGIIHATAGRVERAEEVRRERVEVCRKAFGVDAAQTADAEYDLIFSLGALGKWKEAEPIAVHSLSVLEKTSPDVWFTAHTHLFLSIVASRQGKVDEVERHLLAAAKWATTDRVKGAPPTASQIKLTVGALIDFYCRTGNRAAELKWRGEWSKRVRETLPPPRAAG